MRDYALKMWNADPVKNGVSAVDLYWRKGIYDTFTAAKSIKQAGLCASSIFFNITRNVLSKSFLM